MTSQTEQDPKPSPQDNAQVTTYSCWYIPPGVHTVFGSKKGVITLKKGWLSLADLNSGEEVYKYELAPDIKVGNMMGEVRISFMNGQKNGILNYQYLFYFFNPRFGNFRLFMPGKANSSSFVERLYRVAGA